MVNSKSHRYWDKNSAIYYSAESRKSSIINEIQHKINKIYFKKGVFEDIRENFLASTPNGIRLMQFLDEKDFNKIKEKVSKLKFKMHYEPEKRSYSKTNSPKELSELIFLFAEKLLNIKTRIYLTELLKLSHKDYIVLTNKSSRKSLLLIFDFNDSLKDEGGYISIVLNNQEISRIHHYANSLSIASLPKNSKYFIKYVNHYAREESLHFLKISV